MFAIEISFTDDKWKYYKNKHPGMLRTSLPLNPQEGITVYTYPILTNVSIAFDDAKDHTFTHYQYKYLILH